MMNFITNLAYEIDGAEYLPLFLLLLGLDILWCDTILAYAVLTFWVVSTLVLPSLAVWFGIGVLLRRAAVCFAPWYVRAALVTATLCSWLLVNWHLLPKGTFALLLLELQVANSGSAAARASFVDLQYFLTLQGILSDIQSVVCASAVVAFVGWTLHLLFRWLERLSRRL